MGSNPGRDDGRMFSPMSTFCGDCYFAIRSTPVLPRIQHVKGPRRSQKKKKKNANNVFSATFKFVLQIKYTVNWYGVRKTCAETATVLHGTSRLTSNQRSNHVGEYSKKHL